MRLGSAFYLFVLLSGSPTSGQVLPTSNGSCRVSASGLEACEWLGALQLRKGVIGENAETAKDKRSKLFVTRYILAPGAPLNPPIEGRDVVIVGMNDGELLNEKKSTQGLLNVTNGLVMLMPREEPYLLRNVGEQRLELVVIEVEK